ncbi:hypothetical protein [Paraburkholderia sp. C35]|uniref:hypothetical protein n=1 Tax=Paraburkholderia sp. C35 TaxID=2126993 RepID=UPI00194E1FFB|nr:hypothetical protein [Paraburkholderia sp. C35]
MNNTAANALRAAFERAYEHGDIPLLMPHEPAQPSLARVSPTTNERAARVIERCRFHITGYVLSDTWELRKAIVEEGAVRWLPNREDFTRVMQWQDTKGPNTPPDEAIGDELIGTAAQAVSAPPMVIAAPAAPSRPVLTAPPSARLLESTEEALGVLAGELGCVRNEDIPHNAGWFVPGKAKAYASALDAIKGLVSSLKAGGTVYEKKAAAPKADVPGDVAHTDAMLGRVASEISQVRFDNEKAGLTAPVKKKSAPVDDRQDALF